MYFDVSPDAYARFMGRYSEQLAAAFADLAGVGPGQQALDVGCGPGVLTAVLIRRLGPQAVTAIDPSESFIAAVRARWPEADVRLGAAEELPFGDGAFDVALAQLVVHFMADPVAGLREMARVTRPGGTVAASVWDHAGGRSPLTPFWEIARELDPAADDGSWRAGGREGELAKLFTQAGLAVADEAALTVTVRNATFEDWWDPFTLGVSPAGAYIASLPDERRAGLREHARRRLSPPIEVSATAWAVTARR
ncbi:MAG: class I SAM-dependent methyltransferase [Streptosporangiaceae bacterium]